MAPYSSSLESLSPLALEEALSARNPAPNNYIPGHGAVPATNINNNAIFALFGILGAGFVITSFWFFFWAKNGGFRWRKGDWEDYKTTVLRRKGPNGTLLSGATKSTNLGNGSIVGSQGSMETYQDLEKGSVRGGKHKKSRGKQVKNSEDVDVRAYRHERVAKVGGINREADGSHYEATNTEASSHGGDRHTHANRTSRRDFSYVAGTESNFSTASNDSRRPLRPSAKHADENSTSRSHRSARHTPRSTNNRFSGRTSNGGSYTDPLDLGSHHEGSLDGSEQVRNTKSYHHPIAGLGRSVNSGY